MPGGVGYTLAGGRGAMTTGVSKGRAKVVALRNTRLTICTTGIGSIIMYPYFIFYTRKSTKICFICYLCCLYHV